MVDEDVAWLSRDECESLLIDFGMDGPVDSADCASPDLRPWEREIALPPVLYRPRRP
jgi:hypothetical protein